MAKVHGLYGMFYGKNNSYNIGLLFAYIPKEIFS